MQQSSPSVKFLLFKKFGKTSVLVAHFKQVSLDLRNGFIMMKKVTLSFTILLLKPSSINLVLPRAISTLNIIELTQNTISKKKKKVEE